jgi:hypothetical protein
VSLCDKTFRVDGTGRFRLQPNQFIDEVCHSSEASAVLTSIHRPGLGEVVRVSA